MDDDDGATLAALERIPDEEQRDDNVERIDPVETLPDLAESAWETVANPVFDEVVAKIMYVAGDSSFLSSVP
ncbi:hypothetical protein PINS_up016557 [Pythium insidiosum]|nr:hypothetical protein PINS_up016557 [Pythium insidiosum]